MVRMIGAGMLLTASAALGFGAAGELKSKVDELEQLVFSLELMERELSGRLTPLPELFMFIGEETCGSVKEFYLLCASASDKQTGRPFVQLWSEAAEAAQLRLSEQELRQLREAGAVLGRYDAASQCAALSEVRARLNLSLETAREERTRMGRVYGTLGVAAGAFLSIILL